MRTSNHKMILSLISLVLCACLVCGCSATGGNAASSTDTSVTVADTSTPSGHVTDDKDKDETVYVFSTSDGAIKNITVSDHLHNAVGASELKDISRLQNITNVKGDEAFSQDGSNLTWQANGNDIDELNDMQDDMDELTDAMNEILDGGDDVAKYMKELYEKTGDLVDGVKKLYDGSTELNSKLGDLNSGLQQIVGTDNTNSKQLRAGAKQIVDTVFSTATAQLRAELIKSGTSEADAAKVVLSPDASSAGYYVNVLAALAGGDPTPAQIGQADMTIRAQLTKAGISDKDTQSLAMGLAYGLLKDGTCADAASALTAAGAMLQDAQYVQTAVAKNQAVLATNTDLQKVVGSLMTNYKLDQQTASMVVCTAMSINPTNPSDTATITAAMGKAVNAGKVSAMKAEPATIAANVTALDTLAAKGAIVSANTKLSAVKTQLDSIASFLSGINTYTAGVDTAAAGCQKLKDEGSSVLASGLKELYDKVQEMRDKVKELYDGTVELRDGLHDFNEDGIQKITDLFTDDVEGLDDRISAVSKYSKEYTNYSGIANGMSGSVKFIYKLDPIGED